MEWLIDFCRKGPNKVNLSGKTILSMWFRWLTPMEWSLGITEQIFQGRISIANGIALRKSRLCPKSPQLRVSSLISANKDRFASFWICMAIVRNWIAFSMETPAHKTRNLSEFSPFSARRWTQQSSTWIAHSPAKSTKEKQREFISASTTSRSTFILLSHPSMLISKKARKYSLHPNNMRI